MDGAWLVVSTAVGVGIFTTPGLVASMVSGPWRFGALWLAGGVLSILGAQAYAELAAAYPRSGGEYVYLREAFGPLVGFLSGWTSLVAGFSGAIAAGAVGFAVYLDRILPGAASTRPIFPLASGALGRVVSPRTLVSLSAVVLLTLVHARGLERGRRLQNVLGAASAATIVALVVAGLMLAPHGPLPPAEALRSLSATGHPMVALVLVMFTYSGWNAATYVAGEIRRPGVTIQRGLLLGTASVMALYFGLNLLYVRALTFAGLQGVSAAADAAGASLFGERAAQIVAMVVMLALLGGVSAMIMTGPRIYFAMARDGALPAFFSRVDPQAGVPASAIIAQSAWSSILVLTGTFESILTYTGFAVVLFATAGVASLFVLRRRPGGSRPGRTWAYPVAPALFVAMGVAMTLQSIHYAPGPSLVGLGVIGVGIPVYLWNSRASARRRPDEDEVVRTRTRGRGNTHGPAAPHASREVVAPGRLHTS